MQSIEQLKERLTSYEIKEAQALADVYICVDYSRVNPDEKERLKILAMNNSAIHHLAREINNLRSKKSR